MTAAHVSAWLLSVSSVPYALHIEFHFHSEFHYNFRFCYSMTDCCCGGGGDDDDAFILQLLFVIVCMCVGMLPLPWFDSISNETFIFWFYINWISFAANIVHFSIHFEPLLLSLLSLSGRALLRASVCVFIFVYGLLMRFTLTQKILKPVTAYCTCLTICLKFPPIRRKYWLVDGKIR